MPELAAAQAQYHVLEKGETLYSVARAYGVKPDDLAKANSIDDPSKLRVGKKLLIPRGAGSASGAASSTGAGSASDPTEPLTHKVAKGETLFSLSRTYGVSVDSIRSANGFDSSSVLKIGMTIKIPAEGKPAASAATSPSPSSAETQPEEQKPAASVATKAPASSPAKSAPTGTPVSNPASPAVPDPVKISSKAVNRNLSWPCPGELLYLDGKAYGVIIKTKEGEVEKAVTSGVVSSAGPYRGYGNVVFVLSKSGHIYVYGGNDSLDVKAGDRIKAGQELGRVGLDAKQGGAVAYFLVFKNGEAIDPAAAPRE